MGKKRIRKTTVFGVVEGAKAEANFWKFLKEIYLDEKLINCTEHPDHGGRPESMLGLAIKAIHFGYDKLFVWLDEDKELNKEKRQILFGHWRLCAEELDAAYMCPIKELQHRYNKDNRHPILIVSQPICVESLILKTLGYKPPYESLDLARRKIQINTLKARLAEVMGKNEPLAYYRERLSREILEEKRKEIPELDLLISMLTV